MITRPQRDVSAALLGPALRGPALGAAPLAAAIRPSQDLSFSPLASSSDNGAKWVQSGLPNARLAAASSAPGGGATLAVAPGGGFQALSAHRGQLSDWGLSSGGSSWRRSQSINVSIPYGSSG